jgi:hypothetical protein
MVRYDEFINFEIPSGTKAQGFYLTFVGTAKAVPFQSRRNTINSLKKELLRRKRNKANILHIVICAGIVPDPLQTLEPVARPAGPGQ